MHRFSCCQCLQSTVVKANSKAKGNLTLNPLPKWILLGKGSHAKMTFVTPFHTFEFNMALFGLAQVPAYFQALINKVLKGRLLGKISPSLVKMRKNTWRTSGSSSRD